MKTDAPLDVQLASSRERIASLEAAEASHKNTLAESQSHVIRLKAENDNLHGRLSESDANMDRIALALPAAGEDTETGRPNDIAVGVVMLRT